SQKNAAGVYPYIRIINADVVVNYIEIENKLIEAIVMLEDADGKTFARWMNESDFVDIELGAGQKIKSISQPYSHGYTDIPLVEVEPLENAQALTIAHSQRTIVNTLSILQQELTDSVFSKFILSGVRMPESDDGSQKKINWSG